MCGIVGIIGDQDAAPQLMEGLKRLEYRGYDSAGIATLRNGSIDRVRAEGKLENLEAKLKEEPLTGSVGIGHTRWATHGVPNESNAHPHATDKVALVHNGIIENFQEIRDRLQGQGANFSSQTDSEVVAHLITHYLNGGKSPKDALHATLQDLHGAFALAIVFAGEHNLMMGARRGSPLAVGYGDGEMFLGSDALALAPMTQKICYLEEGDYAVMTRESAEIYDESGAPVNRPVQQTELSGAMIGKGNYRHFMQKEIFEQPAVIGDTLQALLNPSERSIALPELGFDISEIDRISIIACGTSYYAGMTGHYWLEQFCEVPVDVQLASEFRYKYPSLNERCLTIFISQSGETADTLAALRYAKDLGAKTMSILNVPSSTMARESDTFLRTKAGPEIGVASTKAFTTQLAVLASLGLGLARKRGTLDHKAESEMVGHLIEVPEKVTEILAMDDNFKKIGQKIADHQYVLYLGRGLQYPIALEGALKLKEISYIHAEGYAAGEMKHGPIALIQDDVPVIVLAPSDELFEKTFSNAQEVHARGGKIIAVSDAKGCEKFKDIAWKTICLPECYTFESPILYTLPVQMMAYHAAVAKGTDVDQPRNLAKSVTVE